MSFYFFGVFADPRPGLADELSHSWPDANVVEISNPFPAIACRLPKRVYEPELEDVPEPVAATVSGISARYSTTKFLLLRANCWGGDCFFWGQIMQTGRKLATIDGDQALRRLIQFFGVDIGESELFAPLSREFPWNGIAAR